MKKRLSKIPTPVTRLLGKDEMLINLALDKQKKYLLACSFGPDSMALFHLLRQGKYNFALAHVNYGLRGEESENETKELQKYAKEHNIPLHLFYTEGHKPKYNFQQYARDVRYTFFQELMAKNNYDYVLTGHHADDHIETYLMQKEKGVTTFHYGIKAESNIYGINVKRPLLNVFKSTLQQYCEEENIPYSIDSSNTKPLYKRNKLRLTLMKKMTEDEKRALLIKIQNENNIFTNEKKKLETLICDNKIMIAPFLELNSKEQAKILYLIFAQKNIAINFSEGKAKNIVQTIKKTSPSAMFRLFNDYYFVKAYDYCTIIDIKKYKTYTYTVETPQLFKTPQFTLYLAANDVKPQIAPSEYPLVITTASPHDEYAIKNYQKKVTRMYVDMKMPRHLRLVWPIIKNKNGAIIYVPRYRHNYKPKSTDLMKITIK